MSNYIYFSFQGYPVYELSSFIFFIFPMGILMILYIRMGLSIKQTSGIQRNLPARSVSVAMNGPPPSFEQGTPMANSVSLALIVHLPPKNINY